MTLLFGAVALLGLWWLGRNAARLNPALTARLMRRVTGYAALAASGLFLMRGRLDLAILFAGAGFWLTEGKNGVISRGRGFLARGQGLMTRGLSGAEGARRHRSAYLDLETGPGGDGVARAGPYAGRRLSQLPLSALMELLAACRAADPVGARLLEAHLDGRRPGWRVDAQRDEDPRTRRPPDPGAMTEQQAHEILGLERGATLEQIRAAHRTLMKRLHPDQGGVGEGAARVNAARDRLVGRHR